MPLLLTQRSVNTLIAHYAHNNNYAQVFAKLYFVRDCCKRLISLIFGWHLLYRLIPRHLHHKGLRHDGRTSPGCGTLNAYYATRAANATIITIEPDEKTPLLSYGRRSNSCSSTETATNSSGSGASYEVRKGRTCEFRLVLFVLFLAAGFVIATYLLIAESRLPNMHFTLDLVHRDIWSNMAMPLAGLLNYSNVLNIIITQTGGDSCSDPDSCLNILRALQMQNHRLTGSEVPFNFLIGGDGLTYEVRGWDYQSGFALIPQNSSLVIGLISNYTYAAPTAMQLKSALSLIRESQRRKKLQRQYKIYGVRNVTISRLDGEALFRQVAKWPRFDTLLHVL